MSEWELTSKSEVRYSNNTGEELWVDVAKLMKEKLY